MVTPTEETAHTLRKIAAIEAEAARLGVHVDTKEFTSVANEPAILSSTMALYASATVLPREWRSSNQVTVNLKVSAGKLTGQITWSSTGRTPAEARRAIAMYSRAVEFAENAEAIWNK